MQPEPAGKERRSGSIFRLPLRSKKDKPDSRTQSVSFERGMRTPPHRSSLDERQRNNSTYSRSGLRHSVTDKYGTVYHLEQHETNGTASSGKSFPSVAINDSYERDQQTGEVIDHTDMLHALAPTDSQEDIPLLQRMQSADGTEPGESLIDKFPSSVWDCIISNLDLADLAAVALSCKALQQLACMHGASGSSL